MKLFPKFFIVSLLIAVAFWGCDNTPVDPGDDFVQLQFNISHQVDDQELVFDDIKYTNVAGNTYSVVTLKYFISDITLHNSDGTEYMIDDEHYVDATDPTTLTYSPGDSIPNGDYTHVSFIFGLNATKNVNGYFVNPPESFMEWPPAMGQGYHYMKLEGKYDSAGVVTKNYNTHTGPSMGNQYFIEMTLPSSSIKAEGTNLTVDLMMNINNWYSGPNSYDFNTYGQAIMGNQAAQKVLQENGADVFSVTEIR